MDGLIASAARALAAGDPLAALNWVALRDDAPALALRGIAMARLGDFDRARPLLRRAGRAFGAGEPVARARCALAEAEIALAARDLAWPGAPLKTARETLVRHGDRINAAYAGHLEIRRLLLIGRLDEAERKLTEIDVAVFPPALRAVHELAVAGIALRRVDAGAARGAIARAAIAAQQAAIPALAAEIEAAARLLTSPAARLGGRPLLLDEVEALLKSPALVVDACRHAVRQGETLIPLATRPVLFALARRLGEAWPGDVSREDLLSAAFRAKEADESHRARLRVEIGRLRAVLAPLAGIGATRRGFILTPGTGEVAVLARPIEERHAALLAFLADGEAWSSSALALVLDASQRTVQRTLEVLAEEGKVQPLGRGRSRRWTMPPLPGFATMLLLPAPLPDA